MNRIKRRALFFLCLAILMLTACSPELPDDTTDITIGLTEYYNQYDSAIQTVDILEDNIDKENDIAERICTVTAVSDDGSFQITDSWMATYSLWDKAWVMLETTCLSTEYTLLEGLSENDCYSLLCDVLPEGAQINSIDSDLENFTATAVYTYRLESAPFGDYSTCVTNGTGVANFSWDILDRWTRNDFAVKENNVYSVAFNLLTSDIRHSSYRMSDSFDLDMDVIIEDNIPSITVNEFSAKLDLLGNLSFHNVQFMENESENTVDITFSYIRDIDGIEKKEDYSAFYAGLGVYRATQGDGYIRLSSNSTEIFFENWKYDVVGNWHDSFYIGKRSPLS